MTACPVPSRDPLRLAVTGGILAGLLALMPGSPAAAQTAPDAGEPPTIDFGPMLETLPAEEEEAPPEGDTTVSVPEYTRPGGGVTPAAQDTEPRDILVPLQNPQETGDRLVRLSGEQARETLFVNVPVLSAVKALELSYRTSINVLPDRSQLVVRVNGSELPPIRPEAFEGFETVTLPHDLLVEGRNEITVTVRQAHRIFCGPDASFAIWTELDLNTSGIRVAPAELPLDPTGLAMGLSAQLARDGAIPVRVTDDMSSRVLQGLALRLGSLREGGPVMLSQRGLYETGRTEAALARITVLPGSSEPPEIRRGGDGAIVLAIGSETGDLPDLDTVLPPTAAMPDIAGLPPGRATPLADLGFDQTTNFNRYGEQRLLFRLPDDWLMLSSRVAMLRLLYGFADGLPEGALMLVKVNGTTVRLLPLDSNGGRVQPELDIGFPAPLLTAGPNELVFETIVPGDPPDLPCPAFDGPILEILTDSTLWVPQTPQMDFAGVRAPLTSLRPDQIGFAQGSQDGASAAELGRALESALRPLAGFEMREGAQLTVASVAGAQSPPLAELGLGRRDLEAVFQPPRPEALTEPVTAPGFAGGWRDSLDAAARGTARWIRDLALPGDPPLADWIRGRSGVAVLMMPETAQPDAIWLLVGAQSDPPSLAGALARARVAPHGPEGRFALLTADGTWESWQPSGVAPRLKEPLTPANFRQVAGNYASWAPLYFVAGLFALTLVSVMLALVFVITTRGRRKS